jgi:hypothetical protein
MPATESVDRLKRLAGLRWFTQRQKKSAFLFDFDKYIIIY